jgi:EmrB/QacA subfamily drug resistance transporter
MSDALSLPKRTKVFTMLGALLGLLLAALDQTIVATAGPRIQRDLAIEPAMYVWITSAYLVASTVLVPIYGKLSDLYGRRRVLLVAISIFLLGSLACGLSGSALQLIAFRALQGVGSAGLFTSAFAVVADLFPPAERGKWQGMFGAAWGLSSVVGPLTGGFITDHLGWHWAFFINLPIGVVAVGFIVANMPPLRSASDRKKPLDVAGALALAVAALPLLLGLSLGRGAGGCGGWPWMSWQTFALFGTSVVGTVAFVAIERRAVDPILDMKLFRVRTFTIGSAGAFVCGGAFLGAIVFLPLFMVNVVGVSATYAGLTTTPLTFGIVAANILAGQMVSRIGSYKGLLVGSIVIEIVAFAVLALTLTPDAHAGPVSMEMVLLGIGLGPAIPLFTLAVQTSVPLHEIGVATSSVTFFRQLGSTIGIAVVGTVFASSFSGSLQTGIRDATADAPPQLAAFAARDRCSKSEDDSAVAFDVAKVSAIADSKIDAAPLPDAAKPAAKQRAHATIEKIGHVFSSSFTGALIDVFWLSLGIAFLGWLITIFLPSHPLRGPPPKSISAE